MPARARPVVFLGPTLPAADAAALLDADYRPPAAHGDVLRAARLRPAAIGIVDGLFDQVPSVWHKEVLAALDEGVPVYGSASLGALRAAELAAFGMTGVGDVYAAFARGELEDDDEVAVAHAGAEDGYRQLSDAMVDVRATLAAAVAGGVVDARCASILAGAVKAAYYPERRLRAFLDPADPGHQRLRGWLPSGWVPVKRRDAEAMLRRMRDDLLAPAAQAAADEHAGAAPRGWVLQRTIFLESAVRRAEQAELLGDPAGGHLDPLVRADSDIAAQLLDEVRLHADGDRWAWQAMARVLAARTAPAGHADPLGYAADAFHHALAVELARVVVEEGRRDELQARARATADAQVTAEPQVPVPSDRELLAWYADGRGRGETAGALTDRWARRRGWRDRGDLLRALRRRWRVHRAGS